LARFVIPPEKLRRQSDSRSIKADSTADITPLKGTAGQATARKALRYAIDFPGNGQHVFVRGQAGSRRRRLINSVIEELNPEPRQARDFCFVHSFSNPDRPRLIRLKSEQGRQFQQFMLRIGLFVKERLPEILENDPIRGRREARKVAAEREIRELLKPFEKQIEAEGLGLIRSQSGPSARLEVGIKVMGKPVSLEEFRSMVARKQASETERRSVNEKIERFQPELQRIARQIREIWQQTQKHVEQINVSEAARILGEMSSEVTRQFRAPGVESFLRDVIDDVLEKRVGHETHHLADPSVLYSVNVLKSDAGREQAAVIAPDLISAGNLFGSVDPAWRSGERAVASFRGIHAGALIEADGGFLILDAEDLIHQPQLFRRLVRSLRAEATEILAPTPDWSHAAQSLKPEPVPIDCGVIVFGDHDAYRQLAELDKEFSEQFRILADLPQTVPADESGIEEICQLLAAIVEEQSLLPVNRSGLAAIIDHIGRNTARPGELAIRPGDLAALLREGTFIAGEEDRDEVTANDIEQALQNRRDRASVAWSEHLRRIGDGPQALQTRGKKTARVTLTTTLSEGGESFALPVAVGISVSPGTGGTVMLEGEDADGRGFELPVARLGELVASLLRLDSAPDIHLNQLAGTPPTADDLEAGLLALACGALATLAEVPLKQEILLVASVDSRHQLTPVRRINARIESFHDACLVDGLSGQQGAAIARANSSRLALDSDIIKACTNDTFHIHGLETLNQALELATGQRAGIWKDGEFTDGSVLAKARTTAMSLTGQSSQ
jgi:predicted ATP-dependent protease